MLQKIKEHAEIIKVISLFVGFMGTVIGVILIFISFFFIKNAILDIIAIGIFTFGYLSATLFFIIYHTNPKTRICG